MRKHDVSWRVSLKVKIRIEPQFVKHKSLGSDLSNFSNFDVTIKIGYLNNCDNFNFFRKEIGVVNA